MIPAELRQRPHWVRHVARRPVTTEGAPASSTDPATWDTYAAVRRFTSKGYVLTTGDGLVVLDLDACLDGDQLAGWARRILDGLPATYTERSPSGRGLHVWGVGTAPRSGVLTLAGHRVECYTTARFMTVTGDRYAGAPSTLADLTDSIRALT